MLYRDLVQFTPIETVIQLHDAEKKEKAKSLLVKNKGDIAATILELQK